MLEDRFYPICKQNYSLRILAHATYQAKQTLAAKGLTPSIFLSPFYLKKGNYSMEVGYGYKQKIYKPMPQISVIDYDQYENKNLDQTMMQSIRKTVIQSQVKQPKNVTKQLFQSRQKIQKFLNDMNFHWFQNSLKSFYYAQSLNENNFKRSTLQQPKGLAFILQVNQKSLKQNFDKIKRQSQNLLKRMYYLNSNQIKQIPILAIVLFDPNKGYEFKHAKNYGQSLKSDYGIESILHSKIQINGNSSNQYQIWSNYNRPIFYFNYKLNSSNTIKFMNEEGFKNIIDCVNIHKQRIKKMIQNRLQILMKRYDDNYSVGNKLFGFFKGNSASKQKFLIRQQAQARQIADYMFLLQDYKRANQIYKNILKDFQKRQISIQMDLRYMLALCYQMSKFLNVKVNSTNPKSFIQKQFELFEQWQKMGRQQLTKFLILMLYMIHTFRLFDPSLLRDRYLFFIKKAMNMQDQIKHHKQVFFIMPLLLYEQYSNLNLLFAHVDYRRYCYDTVRVTMRYAEYKLYQHALRSLSIVEKVYSDSINAIQKYVSVYLSSYNLQVKNLDQSLNKIKKAWSILSQMNKKNDLNHQLQTEQFKKMMKNHQKIIIEIQKINPFILAVTDQKNIVIPQVFSSDVILFGQEQIEQVDRRGITWKQVAQNFNQNTQLYREGYNKTGMQKIFKLYDCINSQQKQLLYRTTCPNLSNPLLLKNARISYLNQPIVIKFTLNNPFIHDIQITNLRLIIKQTYKSYKIKQNVLYQKLSIKSHKKETVQFEMIPYQTGLIQIIGLQWIFQKIKINYNLDTVSNKKQQIKPFYHIIKVLQAKGQLKVSYENQQQQLIQGQIKQTKIFFQNCGQKPIQSIYIAYGNHQFYNKKYQEVCISLQPKQKKQYILSMNIPIVPSNIQKDWKIMDKKMFLYKTDGQFRVHRSSILTLIHKILYHKIICQKLSTHLHLITLSYDKNTQKIIRTLILDSNFQITKMDQTQFQNKSIYYFFLLKKPYSLIQTYNFQNKEINANIQQFNTENKEMKKLMNKQNPQNQQICLLFQWKIVPQRKGLINASNTMIKKQKQQTLPFAFSCTLPNSVKHNYSVSPVLQVAFKIKIKNIFYKKQITMNIKFAQSNLNGIYWQGIIQRQFNLKQNQQIQFQVQMLISNQGIYDISDCIKYTIYSDNYINNISHSQHQKLIIQVQDQSINQTNNLALSALLTTSLKLSQQGFKKAQDKFFQDAFADTILQNKKSQSQSILFIKQVNQIQQTKQQNKQTKNQDNLIDL